MFKTCELKWTLICIMHVVRYSMLTLAFRILSIKFLSIVTVIVLSLAILIFCHCHSLVVNMSGTRVIQYGFLVQELRCGIGIIIYIYIYTYHLLNMNLMFVLSSGPDFTKPLLKRYAQ